MDEKSEPGDWVEPLPDEAQPKQTILIGGTFDTLHRGHKAYIKQAFKSADEVYIELASDEYATKRKKYPVKRFDIRKKQIIDFIHALKNSKGYVISKLNSDRELTTFFIQNKSITRVLAINEYLPIFTRLNNMREQAGHKKLAISEMRLIRTPMGKKISSSMINAGHSFKKLKNSLQYDAYLSCWNPFLLILFKLIHKSLFHKILNAIFHYKHHTT